MTSMSPTEPAPLPTLSSSTLSSLPPSIYYIPNFITTSEESTVQQQVLSQPKPKWTVLTHRRLQTHPSALTSSNILLSAPLPNWLSSLTPRMQSLGIWDSSPHKAPNHVLINEYNPTEGIMPHEDGPAYYPMVATVSLGAPIVLDIYEKGEGGRAAPKWRILQEPRSGGDSLLVTTGGMYTGYMHGIAGAEADENLCAETIANWELLGDSAAFAAGRYERQTRISLTYRDVLKVSKIGNNLFGNRK